MHTYGNWLSKLRHLMTFAQELLELATNAANACYRYPSETISDRETKQFTNVFSFPKGLFNISYQNGTIPPPLFFLAVITLESF